MLWFVWDDCLFGNVKNGYKEAFREINHGVANPSRCLPACCRALGFHCWMSRVLYDLTWFSRHIEPYDALTTEELIHDATRL